MEYRDYNRNLAQRFVNDYCLPIPIINEKLFFYHLIKYQEDMNSWSLWCETIDIINEKYNGNINEFLDDFYNVRDIIVEIPKNNEAYKKFNNMDISVFIQQEVHNQYDKRYQPESKGYYNEENIGRSLVSIDLRKANFQALRYVDKDIVNGASTYEEFVSMYTDNPYIINSKYFRQVVFGNKNWNPGRHITVEKSMMYKVLDFLYNMFPNGETKLVCLNSDEIVLENSPAFNVVEFHDLILNKLGIDVHCEEFVLEGYNFYSNNDNHHRFTFYSKNGKLMCVPGPYYALTHSLYNDEEPSENDYHFSYEHVDCIFNDTFRIEQIVK